MPVSRAVRADLMSPWRDVYHRLGVMRHERRWCRDSMSLDAGVWELPGVLERTEAAGTCETPGLKPWDGSLTPPHS